MNKTARNVFLIGGISSLVFGTCLIIWIYLPIWAPIWSINNSPFFNHVLKAHMHNELFIDEEFIRESAAHQRLIHEFKGQASLGTKHYLETGTDYQIAASLLLIQDTYNEGDLSIFDFEKPTQSDNQDLLVIFMSTINKVGRNSNAGKEMMISLVKNGSPEIKKKTLLKLSKTKDVTLALKIQDAMKGTKSARLSTLTYVVIIRITNDSEKWHTKLIKYFKSEDDNEVLQALESCKYLADHGKSINAELEILQGHHNPKIVAEAQRLHKWFNR